MTLRSRKPLVRSVGASLYIPWHNTEASHPDKTPAEFPLPTQYFVLGLSPNTWQRRGNELSTEVGVFGTHLAEAGTVGSSWQRLPDGHDLTMLPGQVSVKKDQ